MAKSEEEVIDLLREFFSLDEDRMAAVLPAPFPVNEQSERRGIVAVRTNPLEVVPIPGDRFFFDNPFSARRAAERMNDALGIDKETMRIVDSYRNSQSIDALKKRSTRAGEVSPSAPPLFSSKSERTTETHSTGSSKPSPLSRASSGYTARQSRAKARIDKTEASSSRSAYVSRSFAVIFCTAGLLSVYRFREFLSSVDSISLFAMWAISVFFTAVFILVVIYALGFLISCALLLLLEFSKDRLRIVHATLSKPTELIASIFINPVTLVMLLVLAAGFLISLLDSSERRDCSIEYTNSGARCL